MDVLANAMIYPPEADIARCQVLGDLRPELRQQIMEGWAQIKLE
jgi:hypothetical protein